MFRIVAVFGLLALSGCAPLLGTVAAANVASLMHTDKTLPDHAISNERELNCSILHTARNEAYCQPYPPDPRARLAAMARELYCYRTLGMVNCYTRPDYNASLSRLDYAYGYAPLPQPPLPPAPSGATDPVPGKAILSGMY
ncbi:MAG: hypothetical protein D6826_10675 [Alphaproteobacteria bacterium]|nr:MAG: hypothetical protein D6826_10675 [Alphaproteobacteria bacterium]